MPIYEVEVVEWRGVEKVYRVKARSIEDAKAAVDNEEIEHERVVPNSEWLESRNFGEVRRLKHAKARPR